MQTVAGPVIVDGNNGRVVIAVKHLAVLLPHVLSAVTQMLPEASTVLGHCTAIVVVPCPLMIVAPVGTDQV